MEILIDGVKINYEVSGQGQTVVLLHGWGTNMASMSMIYQHLAKNFQVLAFDFPGFGKSSEPPCAWGVGEYADCMEKCLNKMQIKKPILIGHSFGGRISILLGARGIASKIILVDAAGIRPKRTAKYYTRVYSYKAAKKVMSLPGLNHFRDDALALWQKSNPSSDYRNTAGVMRQVFVKVVNEDLRLHLPKIKVPTLLIWGDQDTATPPDDGRLMEKLIPDSGLVLLEGAGHYSYLDRPGQFLLILDAFLKEESKGEPK